MIKQEQKILIVDDKEENLIALEKVLRKRKVGIIRALNGNEALKTFLHHRFALAILDVQMPGMDGYELAELMRGEKTAGQMPIIFMSAVYSDDYYIFKGYYAGAVDYIVKPFNPSILLSKVDVFLRLDRQKIRLMEMVEVEKSKNQLENILMTTPDLVFVISLEKIIETVNRAAGSVTRYHRDQLIGMAAGKLFPDSRLDGWLETMALENSPETGSDDVLLNVETSLYGAGGLKIDVLVSCSRLRKENGDAQGAVLVARDITKRIRAEQKVEHLNIVLRALRNVSKLITQECDQNRLIQRACETLVDTRGYSSSWIVLLDEKEGVLATAGAGLAKGMVLKRIVRENAMMSCGKETLKRDTVAALENISTLCPQCPLKVSCIGKGVMTVRLKYDDAVYGVLAVTIPKYLATDEQEHTLFKEVGNDLAFALYTIESRKAVRKAQKALSLTRERYTELVGAIEDWIWEVDAGGAYTYVSPRVEGLLGYRIEDVLGKTPDDFLENTGFLNEDSSFAGIIPTRKKFSGKINRFCKKDGDVVTMETSGTPFFDENGLFAGYFGVARDITERKRMEEQLRQSQKMEAIGTLAGGIAHDFNNILFPITAYTEMSMELLNKNHPVQDYLTGVLQSADRAKELIRQILSISRSSGHDELAPLMIQPIIKEVLKLIRASIPTTIEIIQNIKTSGAAVMADPTQIHQIVMNLCTNAFHAMQDTGGTLKVILDEVTSDKVKASNKPAQDRYLCLSVSDTGPGLTKQILSKIFDPYFTTKDKGTGLGLSIVRGIVKNYGGDICVESQPGKGSTFYVYLPVVQDTGTSGQTDAAVEVKIRGGWERILLIDDEEKAIIIEKLILSGAGYRVTGYTQSLDAMARFRSEPDLFDLVITDMTMPKMTGLEVANTIQEIRPALPVILCSGYNEALTKEKIKTSKIAAFLEKPVRKETFLSVVRNTLDRTVTRESY